MISTVDATWSILLWPLSLGRNKIKCWAASSATCMHATKRVTVIANRCQTTYESIAIMIIICSRSGEILVITVAQSIPEILGLGGSQSVIVHVIRDPNYCPLNSLSALSLLEQPYYLFVICLSH